MDSKAAGIYLKLLKNRKDSFNILKTEICMEHSFMKNPQNTLPFMVGTNMGRGVSQKRSGRTRKW
jgi:expansin (peptidoglycan-binding protein)